ncbi:hypothetical protein [Streptomyces sviceus]|uniref:hypothetical protein n=1 Tax=Streptomyces sviceus TaxID=285530 RepID=UPI0036B87DB8
MARRGGHEGWWGFQQGPASRAGYGTRRLLRAAMARFAALPRSPARPGPLTGAPIPLDEARRVGARLRQGPMRAAAQQLRAAAIARATAPPRPGPAS